jgi:hypothetical protein
VDGGAGGEGVLEDDGDMCILGELELEDPRESNGKTIPTKVRSSEISYAAAAVGIRGV